MPVIDPSIPNLRSRTSTMLRLNDLCNEFGDERGKIRLLYRTQVYLARAHR